MMQGKPKEPWKSARKILCIRLDALGDVLMTLPAIRAIRDTSPECEITLLTSPSGAVIQRIAPGLDHILSFEAPWVKSSADAEPDGSDELRRLANHLRDKEFDAAVIFTVYSQNPLPAAVLCFLADIPLRLAHCRENPYSLLSDWIKDTEPEKKVRHEVRRQLDLVSSVGFQPARERMEIYISASACSRVTEILKARGLKKDRPWAVIHPGARAPSRRYPASGFVEASRLLIEKEGWQIVFTGDPSERGLVMEIQHAVGAGTFSLAGELEIEELCALIGLAPILISNNSGPVHIASSTGTPVVDLYALTNPQHTPWMVPHRVLYHDVPCRYCYKSICPEKHHHCLTQVSPESIYISAIELHQETRSTKGGPAPCLPWESTLPFTTHPRP